MFDIFRLKRFRNEYVQQQQQDNSIRVLCKLRVCESLYGSSGRVIRPNGG